jgi:hypothetical protein
LGKILGYDRTLKIIIGLESADDIIRNRFLNKNINRIIFSNAFKALKSASRKLKDCRLGAEVNLLIGCPGTSFDTAAKDAALTAQYIFSLSKSMGLAVTLNFNPYYRNRRSIEMHANHPSCSIEQLIDAVLAVQNEKSKFGINADLFIGLHSEEHDQGEKLQSHDIVLQYIEKFNISQDSKYLIDLKTLMYG